MQIREKVANYISEHGLLEATDRVLVTLSGGPDSVAMLHLLREMHYPCYAVHCNFHLRNEESNRDEAFVRALCERLKVPYEVVHFDTNGYASEQHVSIEMAARELRYAAFERICDEQHLTAIAVAHHQDDSVETFVLNLVRGAGINGLTGIRPRNGRIVRPLLGVTRKELLTYLDDMGETYVTDSTNLDDVFARNKVRLNIVPMMQQINSAATQNIAEAAQRLADAATLYNEAIDRMRQQVCTVEGDVTHMDIAALKRCTVPATLLFEILHPAGFNPAQVREIYQALEGEPGRRFYSPTHCVLKDRELLILSPTPHEEEVVLELPEQGELALPDGHRLVVENVVTDPSFVLTKGNDRLYLDATRMDHPLTLRHPQQGDRFRPFGMKGSKLVSDYLTDCKLSLWEKQQQWLLCEGDDILWIAGRRTSERCRIDDLPPTLRVIRWL